MFVCCLVFCCFRFLRSFFSLLHCSLFSCACCRAAASAKEENQTQTASAQVPLDTGLSSCSFSFCCIVCACLLLVVVIMCCSQTPDQVVVNSMVRRRQFQEGALFVFLLYVCAVEGLGRERHPVQRRCECSCLRCSGVVP